MASSIYINSTRKVSQRRKGKYRMVEFKNLKTTHGQAVAKQLRDSKKQMETDKEEGDTTIYWMSHPDFPGKEDRIASSVCVCANVHEPHNVELYIYIYHELSSLTP